MIINYINIYITFMKTTKRTNNFNFIVFMKTKKINKLESQNLNAWTNTAFSFSLPL